MRRRREGLRREEWRGEEKGGEENRTMKKRREVWR